jgi:hypothetical protein
MEYKPELTDSCSVILACPPSLRRTCPNLSLFTEGFPASPDRSKASHGASGSGHLLGGNIFHNTLPNKGKNKDLDINDLH